VKRVLEEDGQAVGLELSDGKRIQADSVIVATGGLSYPSTGSTGDGYRWAEATGHKVVACTPSLVPFVTEDTWCAKLQGLALKNVNLALYFDGKEIYQGFGEMLFTHFGVTAVSAGFKFSSIRHSGRESFFFSFFFVHFAS